MIDMRSAGKSSGTYCIFNDRINFLFSITQIFQCSGNGLVDDFKITAAG